MLDAIIGYFTGGDEAEQTADDTMGPTQVDSPQQDMEAPEQDGPEEEQEQEQEAEVEPAAEPANEAADGGDDAGPQVAESWEAVLQGQVILQVGFTGQAVSMMQEQLTAAGNGIEITGEFGATTEETVKAFQKAWGIEQNGMMGPQTANALDEVVAWNKVVAGELLLRLGDEGPAVSFLQRGLAKLKYDNVAHTGTFDDKTKAAVRRLQDNAGESKDGIVGKGTAGSLMEMLEGGGGGKSYTGDVDWLGGGANFQITHYTYAREDDPIHRNSPKIAAPGLNEKYRASFLGKKYGVGMQGTGLAENGKYIRWAGGGRYAYGVGGAYAKVDKPYQQIAIDPRVIRKRSEVVVEPYRNKGLMSADDVGGAIKGNHIDVFVGPVTIKVAYALGTKYGRVGYPRAGTEAETDDSASEGGEQKPLIQMSAAPWINRSGEDTKPPSSDGEEPGGGELSHAENATETQGGDTSQSTGSDLAPENAPIPRPRPRPPLSQGWEKLMNGDIVLERGDNGPTVEELQRRLDAAGFGINVDGDYGRNTRNKVRAFQRSENMGADGIVGKNTAKRLYQLTIGLWIDSAENLPDSGDSDQPTAEVSEQADGSDGTQPSEPPLSDTDQANQSADVIEEQDGGETATEGEQTVDGGQTDAETETGDAKTEAEMLEEAHSAEWKQVIAGEVVIKKGMKGDLVEELQRRLAAAGFQTGVDGDFGNGTKRTVMELQAAAGQKPDGVVGKDTASAITQSTAWKAVLDGKLVLKKGMKGPAVKQMQLLLTRAGHGVQQTGILGDTTEQRIKDFQDENKIEPTLQVGATTAKILQDKAESAGKDGFIWPMRGGAKFTSPWGPRNVKNGSSYHKGIDIQGNMSAGGTPIIAAASGKVTYAAFGANGGYGAMIDVEHEIKGRKFFTRYAHLAGIHVSRGQKVQQAQHIGDEGGSGSRGARSYPYHLHFEIHEGSFNNKVDPLKFLQVPGDVQISFGNSQARLARYGNFKRSEDTSIWDY